LKEVKCLKVYTVYDFMSELDKLKPVTEDMRFFLRLRNIPNIRYLVENGIIVGYRVPVVMVGMVPTRKHLRWAVPCVVEGDANYYLDEGEYYLEFKREVR